MSASLLCKNMSSTTASIVDVSKVFLETLKFVGVAIIINSDL